MLWLLYLVVVLRGEGGLDKKKKKKSIIDLIWIQTKNKVKTLRLIKLYDCVSYIIYVTHASTVSFDDFTVMTSVL